MRFARPFFLALFLIAGVRTASAFALLGPFAPWMTSQLSYQDGVSIGGPMDIGEGYRWNVPVITYGYDQSFLDFFGTNGVAAVESAIQMLNNLPPASQIDPSNFPLNSSWINYQAQNQNLIDLKSYALSLLLEHMGLAQPTRYVYCLHDFSLVNGTPNYTMLNRNFGPFTRESSTNLNGVVYDDHIIFNQRFEVYQSNVSVFPGKIPMSPVKFAEVFPLAVDPSQYANFNDAVADSVPGGNGGDNSKLGRLFRGLTQDDAGGMSYLLNSNTVALESLLPGVQGTGTNASNYVNTALRPGVEKITFQRMDYILSTPHVFPVVTNTYVDSYFTNGILQQQSLQRVITRPDILFTAHSIGLQTASRTGTTNWVNNGAPGHDGPGVIQPPVEINFNRLGPSLDVYGEYPPSDSPSIVPLWGSFDPTPNPPIVYPVLAVTNGTTFYFELSSPFAFFAPQQIKESSWTLSGQPGATFSLQTSTNLHDWIAIGTITNLGGTFTYYDNVNTNTPQRYFRTVAQ